MAEEKITTARSVAMTVLNQFDSGKDYTTEVLKKQLPRISQRQHATDLVFGTTRNRLTIDNMIEQFSGCSPKNIPRRLLNTIRIGAYELIYCPKTAEYAIVSQAVETTKNFAGKKQLGFVNAVLRQIEKHIVNRQAELALVDPRKILPQSLTTGCEFDTEILPDPEKAKINYLSESLSMPIWIVEDWNKNFGFDKTRDLCFASNRKPTIYVKTNTLKATTEEMLAGFEKAGLEAEAIEEAVYALSRPRNIADLPGYKTGSFVVQDITAQHVVKMLKPEAAWTILDLCSAPGTKTAHLAEVTQNKANIFATDIDKNRLQMVNENIKRLGLISVTIFDHNNLQTVAEDVGYFDCILADVPCSNTGVLARRPEARYKVKPSKITKLVEKQMEVLRQAVGLLKPGGVLCYSTCSIQKEENTEVIQSFLENNESLELLAEELTLPRVQHPDHDGGYVAILSKS